jgi:hypothetical protein
MNMRERVKGAMEYKPLRKAATERIYKSLSLNFFIHVDENKHKLYRFWWERRKQIWEYFSLMVHLVS